MRSASLTMMTFRSLTCLLTEKTPAECQVLALPFTLGSSLTGAFSVVGRREGANVTAVHRLTLPEVPVTG
eukprot:SAG31_NODE_3898_length_3772_cov_2.045467_3_plen_70_part_00